MTKLNELESKLLSTIASRENDLVNKMANDITKVSDLITAEIFKCSEIIASMKIESVETKDELLTKIEIVSKTDIKQLNELIQKL